MIKMKNLKVLHLTTHVNMGGITIYIARLMKPLQKIGVECSVLSSGGSCSEIIREKGAQIYELPIKTKSELHPKLYLNLGKVISIIKNNKIDLIHAHTRVTQVMAYWIEKMTGTPYVSTCHGFYKKRLGRRLLPAWGKYVIGISDGVATHLAKDFGVPEDRVKTIFNAIDIDEIDASFSRHSPSEAKQSFGFNSSDRVVGVVARLVQDKGHEFLIQAVKLLSNEIPNLKVLIVGDGNYRQSLERLANSLQVADRIKFLGNVQDVTKPLAAMDVFTLPAVWREGFGLSIVEAMACYRPVIVTNIWALNSLIQDRVTGLLIPPSDSKALAAAIKIIFSDDSLRDQMGKTAREMTEKLFSIDRMARELKEVYFQTLKAQ